MDQLINLKLSFTSKESVALTSQKDHNNMSLCRTEIDCVRACRVRLCFGNVYTESWENSLGLGRPTWQQVLKANEQSYSSHNWTDLAGSRLVRTCHCRIGHCLSKFFWPFMQAQMICEYVCTVCFTYNKIRQALNRKKWGCYLAVKAIVEKPKKMKATYSTSVTSQRRWY